VFASTSLFTHHEQAGDALNSEPADFKADFLDSQAQENPKAFVL